MCVSRGWGRVCVCRNGSINNAGRNPRGLPSKKRTELAHRIVQLAATATTAEAHKRRVLVGLLEAPLATVVVALPHVVDPM
mmetsp:Transcript_22918/g.48786  ORF Transcript_22918/g.48786 Transcript_22918/m.48786 type:complete len:81 (+) Transcript_22918:1140-1382(+)